MAIAPEWKRRSIVFAKSASPQRRRERSSDRGMGVSEFIGEGFGAARVLKGVSAFCDIGDVY
jgi:hypothetical protein